MQVSPASTENYKVKKHILETVTFDLNIKDNNQIVSVITSEIENPKALRKISKDFSKDISDLLMK